MNKKQITIFAVVLAVLLIGSFAYSFLRINSSEVSSNTSTIVNGQQQGIAVGEPNPSAPMGKISGNRCSDEYIPVCGVNGITYGNPCMAQETTVAYEGECLKADPQAACTMDYNPVCGIDGNTYSNTCVAEKGNGIKVAYDGECTNSSAASGTFLVNSEQNTSNMTAEELAVA
ncbi:MAG TPA: Kazal-type serine protease inhibitor domain-containing protein [Candidatus Nanoarchaeia archaeon]|nr:Kazal-type serine protease inhibitor domain-containing protein [Candidatus Nanoarchaeia archaeon]